MTTQTATNTAKQSNSLIHVIDTNNNTSNMRIKIRLDDECKNGHQDFSITATYWEIGKVRTDRNIIAGGCCHDEILRTNPDLKIFVNLHLCDYTGVPMHGVENGFYFLSNGFNNTKPNDPKFKDEFCSYYRITPSQFDKLSLSENKLRYAINLQNLGILSQWKEEADTAISMLEKMTDTKFIIDSKRTQYTAPTKEEIETENKKQIEGYYTESKIEERKKQVKEDAIRTQYRKIEESRDNVISKANREYQVQKAILDAGLELDNFIYYDHTNKGVFNWLDYKTKITQSEFQVFLDKVQLNNIEWSIK